MIYAISDIHGDYELFIKLLKKINFSKNDKMIILGDMVDKGEKSVQLLKLLFGENKDCFECIMGNHEHMFLKYYYSLIDENIYSDEEIVKLCNSYAKIKEGLSIELIHELEALPYFIETKDYVCVHASVPLNEDDEIKSLEEASIEELIYDRRFKEPNLIPNNSKCVLYGHTPTFYLTGSPEIITYKKQNAKGNVVSDYYKIHLDTGSYLTGVLGCFFRYL